MPKIKVFSYSELLEVSKNTAEIVERLWLNKGISDTEKIKVGTVTIFKRDIRGVFFDSESTEQNLWRNNLTDYYKVRDEIIASSSEKKARRTAWGHFKLFYRCFFKSLPDENTKQEILKKAEDWFVDNPLWAKPSMKLWFEYFNEQGIQLGSGETMVFNILERIEASELDDIRTSIEYQE